MVSQQSHANIARAEATHISCIPYLDGALLMVSTDGSSTTLQIDGQQFAAIRTCLDAFAATGHAQHHHTVSERAIAAVEIAAAMEAAA